MNQQIIPDEQHYLAFLDDIKKEIRKARVQVARTANRELIKLYWSLGKVITQK